MRILGIDPGLTRCGFGLIDVDARRQSRLVSVGVVRTDPELPLVERLATLHSELRQIIADYKPDSIAVERVFSQLNVRTAMGTAQASAVAMLLAHDAGIPVHMYTPTEVKAAVTGYGRADKKQIGTMVTRILRLTEMPKPADAADALALALCHSWRGANQSKLLQAATLANGVKS